MTRRWSATVSVGSYGPAPINPHAVDPDDLVRFVAESNRIEGITHDPTGEELAAYRRLLSPSTLRLSEIMSFAADVANAQLRCFTGQDVRVGNHIAPRGGPEVESALVSLLAQANQGAHPHLIHVQYETLHPFMDGNGRSGRAIWLWQMLRQVRDPHVLARGFLHTFYYQTLSESRMAPSLGAPR